MVAQLTRLVIIVLTLTLAQGVHAQVRDLTDAEKDKVRDTLDLVEEMYKKAGKLDSKMTDALNPATDPGGAGGQVPYEGSGATFRDAINKMRDKLDQDRIRVDPNLENGARTRNKSGTDGDVIILAGGQLKKMCAAGDDGSRFFTKIRLGASLANEMVHVWQIFAGNDLLQCDAERDSDTATLIFLCEIADAFAGTTGPGDIDGVACPKLKACLTAYGVDAGAEWGVLTTNIPKYKEYYEKRRKEKFDDKINASLSWGKCYYGDSNYGGPIRFAEVVSPQSVRLTAANGDERFYNLPVGKKILRRTISRNKAGQVVLTIVAQDVNTNVICTYVYTDTDGDSLPELTPTVTQSNVPAQNEMDNDDLFVLPFVPGDTEDFQSGWTFIDTTDGTVYLVPIDPLTLNPISPFFNPVFQDPLLSDIGGFLFHDAILDGPAPDVILWIFTSTHPVMNHPDQPSLILEIDLLSGLWNPVFIGSMAEALFPTNHAGILNLDVGLTPVELIGFPGGEALVLDIGLGPGFPAIPPQPLDPNGFSGPIPIPPTPAGLFLFVTNQGLSLSHQAIMFQPPLGENIACALPDENGDGTNDRLQLTVEPPRLHGFAGLPGDPLNSMQHLYELVLETDLARGFLTWDDINGRFLSGMEGPIEILLTFQDSFGLPIYVQSLHDLDGDGLEDDTVVIRSFNLHNPQYEFEVFLDVDTIPVSIQIEELSLVPVQPFVFDLGGDPLVDLQLSDFNGGPDVCFINDGSGQLVLGPCVFECLADVNHDGLVTPTDFTAWINAFNNNLPECDQNGDGACTPTDFTAWIANFNAGC
jgi:hypothetical protein